METKSPGSFQKRLTLFDATAIVAGSMIGSGIYIVSADIARNVGSPGWLLPGMAGYRYSHRYGCPGLW